MASRNVNTRKLLADAARAEFAAHGYSGARTASIARRAGVNKQLLFYYFGSKRELYRTVLGGLRSETLAPTGENAAVGSPGTGQLRKDFAEVFQTLTGTPDSADLLVRGLIGPGGREDAAPVVRVLIARLARRIRDGQGLGHFRDDADAEVAARQAVVLLLGYLAFEGVVDGEVPAPQRRDRWLRAAGDLLLRSLSW